MAKGISALYGFRLRGPAYLWRSQSCDTQGCRVCRTALRHYCRVWRRPSPAGSGQADRTAQKPENNTDNTRQPEHRYWCCVTARTAKSAYGNRRREQCEDRSFHVYSSILWGWYYAISHCRSAEKRWTSGYGAGSAFRFFVAQGDNGCSCRFKPRFRGEPGAAIAARLCNVGGMC